MELGLDGCIFVMEPTTEDWGTAAVFKDQDGTNSGRPPKSQRSGEPPFRLRPGRAQSCDGGALVHIQDDS
jgi:hypothetical protein